MVQGPGSQGIFIWNDKEGGFSASDGLQLQTSLFASVNGEDDCFGGFDRPGADVKRIKLMESNQQAEGVLNLSGESSPLGLTLRKTPSFLDLIETKLSQGWKTASPTETDSTIDFETLRSRTNDFDAQPIAEKLKASNFSASLLRIGTWERLSKYEGDLVAKCYYAKRKLVWEVLDRGLKSKIEIQWSDISAIRAIFRQNEPGILEIELNHAPLFFREINPQPRKHTLWHAASDFTGGQAPICRRHYLQFPEGTLEKHYEKLLQCDNRLFMLSQKPFPTSTSSYLYSNLSGYQDFSFEFNGCQPEVATRLQFPHLGIHKHTLVPSHQVHKFEPTIRPSISAKDSTSPMSVTDFPPIEENGDNHGIERQRTSFLGEGIRNDENIHRGKRDQFGELSLIASANQVGPFLPRRRSSHLLSSGNGLGRLPFSNNLGLNEIAEHLLNDPHAPVCSDEQRVIARVKSWYSLLEASKELTPTENISAKYMEYGHEKSTNNVMVSKGTNQSNGDGELLFPEPVHLLPALGSNENLMMHLPRNTSFSYLFMDQMLGKFADADAPTNGVRGK